MGFQAFLLEGANPTIITPTNYVLSPDMETTKFTAGTQIINECPFCHKPVVIAAIGFDCLYCRIHLLPLSGNCVAVIKEKGREIWTYQLPFTIFERILKWLRNTVPAL